MKPTEVQPWMYEVYFRLSNNHYLFIDNSFESARLFVVDFERTLDKLPSWYRHYIICKAEGFSDGYISHTLRISVRTLHRKIEVFRNGGLDTGDITQPGLSASKLLASPSGAYFRRQRMQSQRLFVC